MNTEITKAPASLNISGKTILFKAKNLETLKKITAICFQNNISFEFMNSLELYFYIYDYEDFARKRLFLGKSIICEEAIIT
jgi:hypothetical protein